MEIIIISIVFLFLIIVVSNAETGNFSPCPNCKREYKELEEWSFAEYSWGLRCPHCKHEFDIKP